MRQGLSFCEARIRCTDWGEMSWTILSRLSARASSAQVHKDRDRPVSSGSSQASLIRWAATWGGKAGWPATPRSIEQALEPLIKEAPGPLAHDAPLAADHPSDGGEGVVLGQQKDGLGANDVAVRRGQRARGLLQNQGFFEGQLDAEGCLVHPLGYRCFVAPGPISLFRQPPWSLSCGALYSGARQDPAAEVPYREGGQHVEPGQPHRDAPAVGLQVREGAGAGEGHLH